MYFTKQKITNIPNCDDSSFHSLFFVVKRIFHVLEVLKKYIAYALCKHAFKQIYTYHRKTN